MEETFTNVLTTVSNAGMKLVWGLIIMIVGIILIRWLSKKMAKFKKFEQMDPTASRFIRSLITVVLYVVLFLAVVGMLGVPLASFVTVVASAGVAISLAMQGCLSNIVGGVMLLILHPFRVGDYVEANGYAGSVKEITLFNTKLLTLDNQTVILPNSSLTSTSIVNVTGAGTRRVDLQFTVAGSSDVDTVKTLLLEVAKEVPDVLETPAPNAFMWEYGAGALQFKLFTWCESGKYWDVRAAVVEAVTKKFAMNGIVMPNPQLDVHMKEK